MRSFMKNILKRNKTDSRKKEDITEIIKKYNIRVSNPYGCYPPDVDNTLKTLETQVEQLMNTASSLQKENEEYKKKNLILQQQVQTQRLNMSLLGIPDEDEKEFVEQKKSSFKLNLQKPNEKE